METSISVLGLGMMGRPMARNLIKAGYRVRGWNRSNLPENMTEGITLYPSLKEAARAEVCLLMLTDSTAADEVLENFFNDIIRSN